MFLIDLEYFTSLLIEVITYHVLGSKLEFYFLLGLLIQMWKQLILNISKDSYEVISCVTSFLELEIFYLLNQVL